MRLFSLRLVPILLTLAALAALPASFAPAAAPVSSSTPTGQARATLSFDPDWRFLKGETKGAEQPAFNDAAWRTVDVPHDWAIEGPFDPNAIEGGAGAFLPTGIGWYRKHFTLPADDASKRIFIDFDGVMANSEVWINGVSLGKRPYGYVSFRYELTDHLKFGPGQANILAVRADNSAQPASRWYAGAGINRHVRLVVTNPVHLGHWATFVSTPHVSAMSALVQVQSAVVNQSGIARSVTVQVTLLGPDGKVVGIGQSPAQTLPAGKTAAFGQDIPIKSPQLWDITRPVLYQAVTRVQSVGVTLDDETTPFGIREFHFDPATGFWLNGKNFKVKGVCLHGDAGALGTAVPLGAWERRLTALKALGVNAIRTAHDPPSPEFLDACDKLGLLVMDEMFDCWTVAKNPYDYHLYFNAWSVTDTRDTVLRDRNHPSIILYSAGNEIHDTPNAALSARILTSLLQTFHTNDPTRPVTQALFRPNASHDYDNGLADMLDVVGQNYRENEILAAHAQKPTRKIIGTENTHTLATWLALRDNPPYAGQFLWTGVDYLGEARHWPGIGASTGLLDRTGRPRARAFERKSWWSDQPTLCIARVERDAPRPADESATHFPPPLFSDWTPADLAAHTESVNVYSNSDQVELLLNGQSLGSLPLPPDGSPRHWQVPFAPGTLSAIGRSAGKIVATQELRTAGPPARIALTADQTNLPNDWDDVSYVRATVVDANGIPVPRAAGLITFTVSGPGTVAAVDNGDRDSVEPFQASKRHAYGGQCIAIVRATGPSGKITLTATAPGLVSGSVALQAGPADKPME